MPFLTITSKLIFLTERTDMWPLDWTLSYIAAQSLILVCYRRRRPRVQQFECVWHHPHSHLPPARRHHSTILSLCLSQGLLLSTNNSLTFHHPHKVDILSYLYCKTNMNQPYEVVKCGGIIGIITLLRQ